MTEAEVWQAHQELRERLITLQREIATKAMEIAAHEDFIENASDITMRERQIRWDRRLSLTEAINGLDRKLNDGQTELRRLERALLLLGFGLHVDNDN